MLLGDLINLPNLLTTDSPIRRPLLPRPLTLVVKVSSPLPTVVTKSPNLLLMLSGRVTNLLLVLLPLMNAPPVVLTLVPRTPQKARPKLLSLRPPVPLVLRVILPNWSSILLPASSPEVPLAGPLITALLVGALATLLEILIVPPLLLNLFRPKGRPALRELTTAHLPPGK